MISKTLQELMDRDGRSQKDLSVATGIPQTTLSSYVIPDKAPNTINRLVSIADYFDVSLDFLVGRKEKGGQWQEKINKLKPDQVALLELIIQGMEDQNEEGTSCDESDEKTPTIYFLLAPEVNRVKIGYSSSPEKRISGIMNASPHELELLGTISGTRNDEWELHQRFSHIRKNREWFDATPELVAYIKQATSV